MDVWHPDMARAARPHRRGRRLPVALRRRLAACAALVRRPAQPRGR